ncbi:MAG: hypothetical protein RIS81_1344, partial [Actinomycetota bacterium]
AGHLLLVIFALLSEALFQARDKILIPIGVFPFIFSQFSRRYILPAQYIQSIK